MTTIYTFNAQANQNYQFNPTLDGVVYVAICRFNVYAQRYYLSIYDTARVLILNTPIVGSPANGDINLLFGYFKNSTLLYRTGNNVFEVTP